MKNELDDYVPCIAGITLDYFGDRFGMKNYRAKMFPFDILINIPDNKSAFNAPSINIYLNEEPVYYKTSTYQLSAFKELELEATKYLDNAAKGLKYWINRV